MEGIESTKAALACHSTVGWYDQQMSQPDSLKQQLVTLPATLMLTLLPSASAAMSQAWLPSGVHCTCRL